MKNWTKQIKDILDSGAQRILGAIVGRLMPPAPIKTVAEIIAELNGPNNANGNWIKIDGFYSLTSPHLEGRILNYGNPTNGIVMVAFLNLRNAEIRTFVAKYLDVPERANLF